MRIKEMVIAFKHQVKCEEEFQIEIQNVLKKMDQNSLAELCRKRVKKLYYEKCERIKRRNADMRRRAKFHTENFLCNHFKQN